ncbi:hypothetical protein E1281_21560 [Actinomadura sp. KC345]|uniref:hypothetical protein n=1 Tax=Actinomadura sp. KC345 TaxID=2530371 RepID=UPI00104554C9|nr:hypothetical protein [Actinomadura sp. KC345]TDC50668.1 hypothetical protein E1281_21560 [Actinomadura sp. KC345]
MSPTPTEHDLGSTIVPAADTDWIGLTSRRLLVFVSLLACAPLALGAATIRAMARGGPVSTLVVWGVIAALLLGAGIGLLRTVFVRARRIARLGFDGHGVWWKDGATATAVPWEAIAGVGTVVLKRPITMRGDTRNSHRVEVFPRQAPDPNDPVLRYYLREGDSPRPDLPRPYLQICLPNHSNTGTARRMRASKRAEEAVRRRRPDLWLGHGKREATDDDHATLLKNGDHTNPRTHTTPD